MMDKTLPMISKPLATCKLGTKGCYTNGKCLYVGECKNKIITNADRIRAMSDEELAEFIQDVSYQCQTANIPNHCQCCDYNWCSRSKNADWLKQPAEDAE